MFAQLIARLKSDPINQDHQLGLGRSLAEAGNAAGLKEMFNFVHQAGGGGGLECALLVGIRLALRQRAQLHQVLLRYDPHCPFRAALVVASGYARALDYDLDAAVAAIRDGLRGISLVSDQVPSERLTPQNYCRVIKSAFLLERSDWIAGGPAPTPSLEVLHQGSARGGFACLAAADSRYFVTYAPDFLADVQARLGGMADPVLVLVDPDAEALACAAELAARHPNATILANAYGGGKLVEYCSGARFVVAPEMLRRLNRPTIFMDIDTSFAAGCADVLGHIATLPLTYQHRNVAPPYLIAEACVVGAHPGETGERFFTDAARYFLAKLGEEGPLWHIDQVALHRASCLARQRGAPPVDLAGVFGGAIELPGYFKKPHTLEFGSRAQDRTDVILSHACSIPPDGKPVFPPSADHR